MTINERIEQEIVKRWGLTTSGRFLPDDVRAIARAAIEEEREACTGLKVAHIYQSPQAKGWVVAIGKHTAALAANEKAAQEVADEYNTEFRAAIRARGGEEGKR